MRKNRCVSFNIDGDQSSFDNVYDQDPIVRPKRVKRSVRNPMRGSKACASGFEIRATRKKNPDLKSDGRHNTSRTASPLPDEPVSPTHVGHRVPSPCPIDDRYETWVPVLRGSFCDTEKMLDPSARRLVGAACDSQPDDRDRPFAGLPCGTSGDVMDRCRTSFRLGLSL